MVKVKDSKQDNEIELQPAGRLTYKENIVPLYTPDDAVVKIFIVHASYKSALALATFALGFQQQVSNHIVYYTTIIFNITYSMCELEFLHS